MMWSLILGCGSRCFFSVDSDVFVFVTLCFLKPFSHSSLEDLQYAVETSLSSSKVTTSWIKLFHFSLKIII